MSEPESLMLQFLTWVSDRRRTYEDTMAAWQSTCPRHTIWEDAIIGGLVRIESANGSGQSQVTLTPRGRSILDVNSNLKSARTNLLNPLGVG
jgi:hypothetical protein